MNEQSVQLGENTVGRINNHEVDCSRLCMAVVACVRLDLHGKVVFPSLWNSNSTLFFKAQHMQKREEFSSNIMCGLFSKQTEPPFFLQHRSIFMVPTSLQGPCMHEGLQYKWANSKHQSPLEKIVICALTLRSGCAQMF